MKLKKIQFHTKNAHLHYDNGIKCIIPKDTVKVDIYHVGLFNQILKQRNKKRKK